MGFENIYIDNKYIVYKNNKYDILDFLTKVKMPKKRRFFILGEGIYIKRLTIKCKLGRKWIEGVVNDLFGKKNNFLLHYEVKRNNIFFYGITKANIITKLSLGAEEIEVEPIQMYMLKRLNKKIKDKKWSLIFCMNNRYYFCKVEDGILVYEKIYKDFSEIKVSFDDCKVYIDKKINNLEKIKGATYVELGGIINEKI